MSEVTRAKLQKVKAELIDRLQNELQGKAIGLQNTLYEAIVDKFIDQFLTDKGIILFNDDNIKVSEAIDLIFDAFQKSDLQKFIKKFASEIADVTNVSIKYHETMSEDLQKFRGVATDVKELMMFRLGLNVKGQLIPKGYLDSFIKDTGLRNSVKTKVLEGVTKQISKKDMLSLLKTHIKGDKPVSGQIVKRFKTTIYDVYQQYDNAMSKTFAGELGLKAFIFAGGIISDSRQFCAEKNGKVFTVEEAQEWKNDPLLPRTKAEKKSGVVVGYDPLINMGRWQGTSETCRHHPSFISNAEAIRRRPDLEGIL